MTDKSDKTDSLLHYQNYFDIVTIHDTLNPEQKNRYHSLVQLLNESLVKNNIPFSKLSDNYIQYLHILLYYIRSNSPKSNDEIISITISPFKPKKLFRLWCCFFQT